VVTGERAVGLARQLGQRGNEARALYLLGNIYSYGRSSDAVRARETYRQALMLARELRMRPLEAQCHLALGEPGSNAGKNQDARVRLTTAAAMFRDMGMQFWLDKAEAALKAL